MANGRTQRGGSAIAWIVSGLVVVAIVAAPFWLGFVSADEDALDNQLQPTLERVAAILAGADNGIASLADARKQLAVEMKYSAASAEKAIERDGKVLAEVEKQLAESGRAISALDRAARGGLGGAPKQVARSTFSEFEKLLGQQEAALREAEGLLRDAKGKSIGGAGGRAHYGVNALSAVAALQQGQLAANRADLLRRLASAERMAAEAFIRQGRDARRKMGDAAARDPQGFIEQAEAQVQALENSLQQVDRNLQALENEIAKREEELKQKRNAAGQAQRELARMNVRPFNPEGGMGALGEFAAYRGEYLRWSDQARQSQARADELEHGALAGAGVELPPDGELLTAKYSGGRVEPGLRMLRAVRDGMKDSVASLNKSIEAARSNLDAARSSSESLDTRRDEYEKLAGSCADAAAEALKRSRELMSAARQAEDQALGYFESGLGSANAAAGAARKRSQDAGNAARSLPPDKPNPRLTEMANDKDPEASAKFLAGQLALESAEMLLARWDDLGADAAAERGLAAIRGDEKSESDASAEKSRTDARTRALAKVDKAIEELSSADKMIGANYNVTVGATRISGAHYRWQFQTAQAAAHLLRSQLLDNAGERYDQREKANQLLAEAAKGREGSPMLQPALDLIEYLKSEGAR